MASVPRSLKVISHLNDCKTRLYLYFELSRVGLRQCKNTLKLSVLKVDYGCPCTGDIQVYALNFIKLMIYVLHATNENNARR